MKRNLDGIYSIPELINYDAKQCAAKTLTNIETVRNILNDYLKKEQECLKNYRILKHSKHSKDANTQIKATEIKLVRAFNTEGNFTEHFVTKEEDNLLTKLGVSLALMNHNLGKNLDFMDKTNHNQKTLTDECKDAIHPLTYKSLVLLRSSTLNLSTFSRFAGFSNSLSIDLTKLLSAVRNEYKLKPVHEYDIEALIK